MLFISFNPSTAECFLGNLFRNILQFIDTHFLIFPVWIDGKCTKLYSCTPFWDLFTFALQYRTLTCCLVSKNGRRHYRLLVGEPASPSVSPMHHWTIVLHADAQRGDSVIVIDSELRIWGLRFWSAVQKVTLRPISNKKSLFLFQAY